MNKLSELQKKDLEYVFHPCAQMKDFEEIPPLVIKKGDGLYLIDEDGNRYMDCISSWWVNLFGHCNERINKIVTEQVNTLEHVIFANFAHEPAALLCEELTKVFLYRNGFKIEFSISLANRKSTKNKIYFS